MSLTITIASPDDAKHIVSIGTQSFHDAFAHLFNKEEDLSNYLSYSYDVKKIQKSIRNENNVYFLAWFGDKPVGFAKVKKFSLNEQISALYQMELQKIYVLFDHHSTGAGAGLINAVISLADEIKSEILWLDVHISNARAIRFYEKNKFKKSGKHFFVKGSQTFEYDLMTLPVNILQPIIK